MVERALLIDVELDRASNDDGQLQTRWTHHPLGLMSLAGNARRRFPDTDFRILHSVTCDSFPETLARTLDDYRPDLVGLRALSLFQKPFAEAAAVVRAHAPNVPLIAGGPYPSSSPGDVLTRGLADLVIEGEG